MVFKNTNKLSHFFSLFLAFEFWQALILSVLDVVCVKTGALIISNDGGHLLDNMGTHSFNHQETLFALRVYLVHCSCRKELLLYNKLSGEKTGARPNLVQMVLFC